MRGHGILLVALLLLCWGGQGRGEEEGREAGERPRAVRLAIVGPLTGPSAPYGRSQLEGATLAAEEANGSGRLPFRLELVAADDRGEHGRVGPLARDLAFVDGVAGFVGCINSACTHVLEMLCVKLQRPQVTCVSTDPSITRAGSPWIFRCLADDERQAEALVGYLTGEADARRVAVVALRDRYGLQGARALERRLRSVGRLPVFSATMAPGGEGLDEVVRRLVEAAPDAVVVWSLVSEGADLVRRLRAVGTGATILGPDGLTTPAFPLSAGPAAEGVILTLPYDGGRQDPVNRRFVEAYRRRFGREADSFAAHAYDAVGLYVAALERAGADPASLRDALAATREYPGATGSITFDGSGNDTRDVRLAVVRGGLFIPLPAAER